MDAQFRQFNSNNLGYTLKPHAYDRFCERWREVNPSKVEPSDHFPEIVRRFRYAEREDGNLATAARVERHGDKTWFLVSAPYRFVMAGRTVVTIELAGEYRFLNKPAGERIVSCNGHRGRSKRAHSRISGYAR